jgi:hypothetical protein
MKRISTFSLLVTLAACGGGEPAQDAPSNEPAAAAPEAAAPAAASDMAMTDWFHVDEANQAVHMTITAGSTDAKNYWNFNGGHDGNMTITVPVGYTITIDLRNNDPVPRPAASAPCQTLRPSSRAPSHPTRRR